MPITFVPDPRRRLGLVVLAPRRARAAGAPATTSSPSTCRSTTTRPASASTPTSSSDAIGDRRDLVVVAQSLGGFTAPLVCARLPARTARARGGDGAAPGRGGRRVVGQHRCRARPAASRPQRDGRGADGVRRRRPSSSTTCRAAIAAAAMAHVRPQSGTPFEQPWPLDAWPDVPTRFLLCRDDRFFPADFQRRVVRERLGIDARRDGRRPPAGPRPPAGAGRAVARLRRRARRLTGESPAGGAGGELVGALDDARTPARAANSNDQVLAR